MKGECISPHNVKASGMTGCRVQVGLTRVVLWSPRPPRPPQLCLPLGWLYSPTAPGLEHPVPQNPSGEF